jgi:hypothetical protein
MSKFTKKKEFITKMAEFGEEPLSVQKDIKSKLEEIVKNALQAAHKTWQADIDYG